jgi:hypothetical protein
VGSGKTPRGGGNRARRDDAKCASHRIVAELKALNRLQNAILAAGMNLAPIRIAIVVVLLRVSRTRQTH